MDFKSKTEGENLSKIIVFLDTIGAHSKTVLGSELNLNRSAGPTPLDDTLKKLYIDKFNLDFLFLFR